MNFEDLLPFYVLDAVTDEERTWIEQYISENADAQAKLDALQKDVSLIIPNLVEPATPPVQIRNSLLERVSADPRAQAFASAKRVQAATQPAKPTPASAPGQQSWWSRFRNGIGLPAFAGAAALAALVAFLWIGGLQRNLNTQIGNAENSQRVADALQADVDSLESRVTSLETELTAQQSTAEVAAQEAEAAIASLQAELDTIEAQRAALQTEQTALAQENEALAAQLATNNGDASAEITALREEVASLEQKAAELELINQSLQDQLDQQTLRLAVFNSPDLATIPVGGTEVQPDAFGSLIMTASGQSAIFNAWQLPKLDEATETYQLWLINNDGPAGVGLFNLNDEGWGTVHVDSEVLQDYTAIGVTVEPAGGSPAPTSDIVLLGTR